MNLVDDDTSTIYSSCKSLELGEKFVIVLYLGNKAAERFYYTPAFCWISVGTSFRFGFADVLITFLFAFILTLILLLFSKFGCMGVLSNSIVSDVGRIALASD